MCFVTRASSGEKKNSAQQQDTRYAAHMLIIIYDSGMFSRDNVDGKFNIFTQFYDEEQAEEAAYQNEGNDSISDSNGKDSDRKGPAIADFTNDANPEFFPAMEVLDIVN